MLGAEGPVEKGSCQPRPAGSSGPKKEHSRPGASKWAQQQLHAALALRGSERKDKESVDTDERR